MKNSKRAERRHHEQRLKRRAARRARTLYVSLDTEKRDRVIGRMARTPVLCSCPMCGNPRRHFGDKTLQERRAVSPCR